MSKSFYMSNMLPQVPAFNHGIWVKFEAQVCAFAVAERKVYVVTGAILPKEPAVTIKPNCVTVPPHYYKVFYELTPPEKMIAFILPNAKSSRTLQDFIVTVNAVEAASGLDFFSRIPEAEQENFESAISVNDWKWE